MKIIPTSTEKLLKLGVDGRSMFFRESDLVAAARDQLISAVKPVPQIGFMRGNHTFITWGSWADANTAVRDPSLIADSQNYEMAFIRIGDVFESVGRNLGERDEDFLARAAQFFMHPPTRILEIACL